MDELFDALHNLDVTLFRLFNDHSGHPFFDWFLLFVSEKWPWAFLGVLVFGWSLLKKRFEVARLCVLIGITLGITDWVTFRVLKPTFDRQRPCYQLEDVRLLQPSCGSDHGLPSNHAANAMATATVLALATRRRWNICLFLAAGLVGYSRVYVGAHFPGDVLFGYVVGALLGMGVFFLSRLAKKFTEVAAAI